LRAAYDTKTDELIGTKIAVARSELYLTDRKSRVLTVAAAGRRRVIAE